MPHLGLSLSLGLLLLFGCATDLVECRTLRLGTCAVQVHTHELRKYHSAIRSTVIEGDNEIGARLLKRPLMKDVQEGQTCCFVRLVLRFYVERVFGNYVSSQPQQQRSVSALANAFVIIRKDIHTCHCHCGEETQRMIDSLHAEFIKLHINQAAQKALGELDTVLDLLEELGQSTQT